MSRLLSPAEYGLADLANTFAAMLSIVVMGAGDIPAARRLGIADGPTARSILATYVWTRAAVGLLAAALLLPFADDVARNVWSADGEAYLAVLAIALIPIGAVQASLVTTLRLQGRPVPFAALAAVDLVSQSVLAVTFVVIGWGAVGLVGGIVAGSCVGLLAAAWYTRGLLAGKPDGRLGLEMVLEGVPFLPAALGFVVATYAVRLMLIVFESQAEVGLFGVALRIASGMTLAASAFSMAWGPFALGLPAGSETARLFGRVLRDYTVSAVGLALAIGALSPEVIDVVSGDDFRGAAVVLPGLLLAAAMSGAFYVLLVAAGVARRGRWVGTAAVLGATTQLLTTAALLPAIGFQAVGIAAVFGQLIALVVLSQAMAPVVHGRSVAISALILGAGVAVWLQMLSDPSSDAMPLRLAVFVVSVLAAAAPVVATIRPGASRT